MHSVILRARVPLSHSTMTRRLTALGVFAVALLVYTTTMIPHVGFTDSGELAGACASLGVAHPTGYPLFVLIGHLWTLLPLPLSVIVKMNLFAAVCTAFSASMMFLL
ncbi:MAG: protein O-mannosyl-transferase family, partial [Candidatus Kapaibacterium sp.]